MNLVPVYPPRPEFRIVCTSCGGKHNSGNAFADLDGPAFKAYVCGACASLTLGTAAARAALLERDRRAIAAQPHNAFGG